MERKGSGMLYLFPVFTQQGDDKKGSESAEQWALYHFIWMPSNSRQEKKKKYVWMRPQTKEPSIQQTQSYKKKINRVEHGSLQDSHPMLSMQSSRHKTMAIHDVDKFERVCVRACVLEMKTANNRQQYPGFACLPSDNNFNLPTEYIHSSPSVCATVWRLGVFHTRYCSYYCNNKMWHW